jgi:tetratricopeptide (TPR) repeat protein
VTTVIDARTGAETDLALILTQLQEQARTGTLKLSAKDGQIKYIYLKRGTIELLKTNRSRTLLGKALFKRRKLTEEQLRAALERQRAASSRLRLGEILVGMGIVLESDVHQALAYQIAEEVFELFNYDQLKSEFYRGEPPLDIFESEDLQARVSLSPIQLVREAIRRKNELVEIQRTVPSLRDVFALTPAAYGKAEAEGNPVVQEVVSSIDGQRSLAELLDVVRAPDLAALRVIVKMRQEGDAVALPAQSLLELGVELEERAEYERARERYLRAEELGHPDFDLPRRIGQIAEALEDRAEACRRYVVYADRCVQAGYPDVATLTLARALELEPEHLAARERMAELLARGARALAEQGDPQARAKALEAGAHYARLLAQATTPAEQRRLLGALVALLPERDDLRERMALVSLALGDPAQAVQDLQELAIHALEAGNLERATGTLTKILEIDPDDILARQSLAATYARMERTGEAVREYLRLTHTLEASGLATASADRMIEIYERVVELDPANTEARRFLAQAYGDKKEADKAAQNYVSIVEALRQRGDDAELLAALEKLAALRPADAALTLERAGLLRKLGRGGEAREALRALADAAARQGDGATAQAAWTELLAESPGDLEAHLAIARLEVQAKDHAAAARRVAAVFELALVVGRADLAEEAVKRLNDLEAEAERPEHRERLARILVLRGRADEAARALVRAARRARDDQNVGLALGWARRAVELDGTCDDARDLLEALKRPPVVATPAPAPTVSEAPREVIQATIVGGGGGGAGVGASAMPAITIDGYKPRKIGGIAERLRNLSGGAPGPAAPELPLAAASKGADASAGAPGEAADTTLSRKASSAMNKLRALKGGGAPSGDASDTAPPVQEGQTVSKGPEGPGDAVEDGLARKASSAMNKLRALKSGGSPRPDGAGSEGGAAPLADGPAPGQTVSQTVSKGPEAPGEAVDNGLAKKATSAMSRLKALKAGGGDAPAGGASGGPAPTQPVSKGPEAPGEAVDGGLAKKATSAMSRLKALKAGGGGEAPVGAEVAPGQTVSKGPEAPGEAVDGGLAKKATSAMSRLKALKSGGGDPPPSGGPAATPAPGQAISPTQPMSKGPEAPGEAVDGGLAKKATSAMSRLKALKSGGGDPPPTGGPAAAPALGQTISKGPEAPGEAVDEGLAKKASSAMSRLKALKAGGGASSPSAPPPPPGPDGAPPADALPTESGDATGSADETESSGETFAQGA